MDVFHTSAVFVTLAAAFSYVNRRFLGLPASIGLMVLGLVASFGVMLVNPFVPGLEERVVAALEAVDFDRALMEGMLGFLLFAGALHVDIDDLLAQKGVIALAATLGLLLSTALVAGLLYAVGQGLGLDVPFAACLVFGALISPTDPIAVLAILKSLGAPRTLEVKIAGESLFNDGFAVVVYLGLLGFAVGGAHGTVEPTLAGRGAPIHTTSRRAGAAARLPDALRSGRGRIGFGVPADSPSRCRRAAAARCGGVRPVGRRAQRLCGAAPAGILRRTTARHEIDGRRSSRAGTAGARPRFECPGYCRGGREAPAKGRVAGKLIRDPMVRV